MFWGDRQESPLKRWAQIRPFSYLQQIHFPLVRRGGLAPNCRWLETKPQVLSLDSAVVVSPSCLSMSLILLNGHLIFKYTSKSLCNLYIFKYKLWYLGEESILPPVKICYLFMYSVDSLLLQRNHWGSEQSNWFGLKDFKL